jgi:hypothetical protein
MSAFESLERAFQKATEIVLSNFHISGFWKEPEITLSRRLCYETCGIIGVGKRARGFVAVGLPRNVIDTIFNQDKNGLCLDATGVIHMVNQICMRVAETVHWSPQNEGFAFKVLQVAEKKYWCGLSPVPRRVLHLITSTGNITLETYIRRIPYFEAEKNDWATILCTGCEEKCQLKA